MPILRDSERLRFIRFLLVLFIIGLLLSGLTAFPLVWELRLLASWFGKTTTLGSHFPELAGWVSLVREGLEVADQKYPFLAYGTDWLAFAHVVIAIAFGGPLKDPVRNRWVVEFGMIACLLVIPLALVCGYVRNIPVFWRLIDCSFGILGVIPLFAARRLILRLDLQVPDIR
jgi:hypothetical protein